MDLALILVATAAAAGVLFAITDFMLILGTPSASALATAYRLRFPALGLGATLLALVAARAALGWAAPVWGWVAAGVAVLLALFAAAFYHPWVFRPVREPRYVSAAEADRFLDPGEEVIGVEVDGEARAFPISMVVRPHVVLDRIGERPIALTYCVLSNSALAFDRRLDGREFDLTPVTARSDNIVYWDRTRGNLVQQLEEGVIWGPDSGRRLAALPTTFTTWQNWRAWHPGTRVLWNPPSSPIDAAIRRIMIWFGITRHRASPKPLFPLRGPLDPRLPSKEEVFGVRIGEEARAYPVSRMRERGVINDELGGRPLVILYDPERGCGGVFDARLDGRALRFERESDGDRAAPFADRETRSRWDSFGRAVRGPLAPKRLAPIPHFNRCYWFAWALYNRGTSLPALSDEPAAQEPCRGDGSAVTRAAVNPMFHLRRSRVGRRPTNTRGGDH